MNTKYARVVLIALIVLTLVLVLVPAVAARGGPDCGRNPYRWNGVGKHYERPFSMYCWQYTHDNNEIKYDGKVCSETPMRWWPCERPW